MRFRSNEDVYSLVKSFEERTLPKSSWTHSAHLAVASFYCSVLPFGMARNVMRDGIHWLNDSHGTPNTDNTGYNETLTLFWLKRIWNLLDSRVGHRDLVTSVNDVIATYSDPKLPLSYYSPELLFSAKARRDYYPPIFALNPH